VSTQQKIIERSTNATTTTTTMNLNIPTRELADGHDSDWSSDNSLWHTKINGVMVEIPIEDDSEDDPEDDPNDQAPVFFIDRQPDQEYERKVQALNNKNIKPELREYALNHGPRVFQGYPLGMIWQDYTFDPEVAEKDFESFYEYERYRKTIAGDDYMVFDNWYINKPQWWIAVDTLLYLPTVHDDWDEDDWE
jgi:hypothetical protein